jgi:hypothetical protein
LLLRGQGIEAGLVSKRALLLCEREVAVAFHPVSQVLLGLPGAIGGHQLRGGR